MNRAQRRIVIATCFALAAVLFYSLGRSTFDYSPPPTENALLGLAVPVALCGVALYIRAGGKAAS